MDWLGRLDIAGLWSRRVPAWLTSLLIGILCAGLGTAGRAALNLVWPTTLPFGLLLPMILLATFLGRWLAGLTCYLLGFVIIFLAIRPGLRSAGLPAADSDAVIVLYALVGGTMLLIAEAYRRTERALRREQVLRAEVEANRHRMLAEELNHRISNLLATVQAIASQTLSKSESTSQARNTLDDRLIALGRAHDLLIGTAWQPVSMDQLVRESIFAFDDGACFKIGGPPITVAPRNAVSLALALHELATNAIKYGALSVPEGQVAINWQIEPEGFRLEWVERGGPPVKAPERLGFGSRLLQHNLAAELGGQVNMEFASSGFRWSITRPGPH